MKKGDDFFGRLSCHRKLKAGSGYEYIHILKKVLGEFMLVQIVDKQRHAVNVVKTALLSVGISGRSICVQVDSRHDQYETAENYSVFVSAPAGAHVEPFYVC